MAKQLQLMTPELVAKLYAVLGIEPPKDRMINKIVITVEAGQPVSVDEKTYPVDKTPDQPTNTEGGNA